MVVPLVRTGSVPHSQTWSVEDVAVIGSMGSLNSIFPAVAVDQPSSVLSHSRIATSAEVRSAPSVLRSM